MYVECIFFTYYRACVLILNIDLPEQPALIVLIHDAWKQDDKIDQHINCTMTAKPIWLIKVFGIFEK